MAENDRKDAQPPPVDGDRLDLYPPMEREAVLVKLRSGWGIEVYSCDLGRTPLLMYPSELRELVKWLDDKGVE